MSTERDEALAALRAWSIPGHRADLAVAAWRAGASVVAIAEAARVKSRQTIYDDLRDRGIDPHDRPKGPGMPTDLAPLNIEGFTGNIESVDDEYHAALRRWQVNNPDADPTGAEAHAEGMRLVGVMDTTNRYAALRDLLAREQHTRTERDRLLHLVELRWEALSTATAWHAAHHAYVCAVDDARIAIDLWRERAEAALTRRFFCSTDRDKAAYRQIQEAGHPALEEAQAALDRKPAETADRLRSNLDQADERRRGLAGETLAAATDA